MKKPFRLIGRGLLVLMDFIWVIAALALCAAWWIGWTYKDANDYTIWLYFIPPILIIVAGFLWLFFTLSHKFKVIQFIVFVTIISCFVKVLVVDHHWKRAPDSLPEDNIRIMHWNTAWGVLGVESVVRTITEDHPDILLISEPPRLDMISDIAYNALEMPHVFTSDGMTLASHFPITYLGERKITDAIAWYARVDTDRGSLIIIAVDIASRPSMDRKKPILRLSTWAKGITNKLPKVLIGDLNTPYDALALKPFRKFMRNSYERNGRGWPYSWPVPLPSYAIDQTWVSLDVTVNDYFYKKAKFSDHKQQVADISLETKKFEVSAENQP